MAFMKALTRWKLEVGIRRFFRGGVFEHYVKQTWFFDVQASYQFCCAVGAAAVPGYSKDSSFFRQGARAGRIAAAQTANSDPWKRLLNDTTVTLGCNNVFGHDPPDAPQRANYADFIYDSTGRFVYVSLQKRF